MSVNSFGERVKHLRDVWGLTQAGVHQAGGPSRTTLYRVEKGETDFRELSDASMDALAKALKCHRQWLELGSGPVFRPGIAAPEGAVDGIPNQQLEQSAPPPVYPELGKYLTDGQTDWAIVVAAVEAVDTSIHEWDGMSQPDIRVYQAEAYRVVYRYLAQQKNPLAPLESGILSALLAVK